MMKKALKIILIILLVIILLAACYVAYVFISYHRIGSGPVVVSGKTDTAAQTDEPYHLVSWNIGFGAYTQDYDFFMDGGTQSWAESPERLDANLGEICERIDAFDADFYLVQEVDIDSTRSYHRDERVPIISTLGGGYVNTFAQNYDSPFLFYPFTEPHGASRSGLLTFSRFDITNALRMELPIETSVMKLVDLDRCYSVNRIPTADGKELVLYNLHLSAYTSDGQIANEQLRMLVDDMKTEYAAGNWCIAGGDFNKDLPGNSGDLFGVPTREGDTWAQPLPAGIIPEGLSLVVPLHADDPHASCRTASEPYNIATTFRITVDGFLVSDNVTVLDADVIELDYMNSDHNPVYMDFVLNAE